MVRKIYTILLNSNNELITTTPKEIIMQKSKLVDSLHFLVDPIYKDADMSAFTMLLEYKLPITNKYQSVILVKSPVLYEEMLEYKLPIDTDLTSEAGNIELQVTLSKLERNETGQIIQRVRKSKSTMIQIHPIAAWSDFIPDGLLTSLDQRILKQDAQINQLQEIAQQLNMTKADDISYQEDILQLTSNGNKIGTPITIASSSSGESGYDIVEF